MEGSCLGLCGPTLVHLGLLGQVFLLPVSAVSQSPVWREQGVGMAVGGGGGRNAGWCGGDAIVKG